MKLSVVRSSFSYLDFACLSYIVLFVYAAISKLTEFDSFRIQLGQSTLVGAYAGILVWAVPAAELAVALLLSIPRYRFRALHAGFVIMVSFSAYIAILLRYSSYVPCSCGGVLNHLGWKAHLVFNIAFAVLALPALVRPSLHTLLLLAGCVFLGIGAVYGLYYFSDQRIHKSNPFIRHFNAPAIKISELDLGFNSYYLSGVGPGVVYLGNQTAPLRVLRLDAALKHRREFILKIPHQDLGFSAPVLKVVPPYFYFADGGLPVVFRGETVSWSGRMLWGEKQYFSRFEVIDSSALAFRAIDARHYESELGLLDLSGKRPPKINRDLLRRQVDGIFDVDGTMSFDAYSGMLAYVHYYSNRIVVTDSNLKLANRFTTIDTVRNATVNVADQGGGGRTFARAPLMVNKYSRAHRNLLFVQSTLTGRYEDVTMWEQASIIDVYKMDDGSYVSSFYIHHVKGEKLKSFIVEHGTFYGLAGHYIVAYRLPDDITRLFPETGKPLPNTAQYQGEDRKPVTE